MRVDRVRDWPGLADLLYKMECQGFDHPWPKSAIESCLRADWFRPYLFRQGGEAVGYALIQYVVDEGELLRFLILPDHRNQGLGSQALEALLTRLEEEGMERMFLEVRQDNRAAQKLYAKLGFEPVGKRKNYYEDGADAYLFSRERRNFHDPR